MYQDKEKHFAEIRDFSHEGLGVATVQGKTVFIENAVPTEQVNFIYLSRKSKFSIGRTTQILKPAEARTKPLCPHYTICGGCALQHVNSKTQLLFKQKLLLKQLHHFGLITPEEVLPPMTGTSYQYRRRARLAVRYHKNNQIELGFKQKNSHTLTAIEGCVILAPELSKLLPELKTLLSQLIIAPFISQIEMALGDNHIAIVIRHKKSISSNDKQLLIHFGKTNNLLLYLQLENSDSSNLLDSSQQVQFLSYSLPAFDLTFQFHPLDFVQVNSEINQSMVSKAFDLLNPQSTDLILDLFSGIGNFTLPLAKQAGQVIGVEGSSRLVERSYQNAKLNGIHNVEFYTNNLTKPSLNDQWAQKKYDKILLDPPRTGALDLIKFIPNLEAKTILYISCDPATLARDTGELIKRGYRLKVAGILDMFPQTSHVESMALLMR